MNKLFLFLACSMSFLSAMNTDEKSNPSSINPKNSKHVLMQHPTADMPDYFYNIRTQLVTMLLEDSSTLYPQALSALARTNKAWAQVVRKVTHKIFTPERKETLRKYRPFLSMREKIGALEKDIAQLKELNVEDDSLNEAREKLKSNKVNQKLIFQFIKELNTTNFLTMHLGFKRLCAPGIGTEVNAKDNEGWTPLHHAADKGHTKIVSLLLANGADKDSENYGWTPLHYAARNGHIEIVSLLLSKGADKDSTDKDGRTPLHLAAYNGHIEIVLLVLAEGADKDSKEKDGWTPLHYAAGNGHTEIVTLLLSKGAEVNIKKNDGKTALDIAKNDEIKQVLLAHKAQKKKNKCVIM